MTEHQREEGVHRDAFYLMDFMETGLGRVVLFSWGVPLEAAFPDMKDLILYAGWETFTTYRAARKHCSLLPDTWHPPVKLMVRWMGA